MPEPAALVAKPSAASYATPAPPPPAAPTLSDEVDLYAEANSFSEADWAGPPLTDLFGEDGLTFGDVLDIVNPLHHLPGVGTVYRAVTGDTLAPAPRVVGGTLFGGIAGFITSIANAIMENETGSDIGDTVLAFLSEGEEAVSVAAADTAGPAAAAPGPAFPNPAAPGPAAPGSIPQGPAPLASAPSAPSAFPVAATASGGGLNGLFRSPSPATAPSGANAGPTPALPPNAHAPPAAPAESGPEEGPPAADVPVMMRRALDKYETLMRDRTGATVSSEI